MTVAASFAATKPLVSIFARPDNPDYDLAVTGNRICTLVLFFIGFHIFASRMFTALSNGIGFSILIFSHSFVFMLITTLILPVIWGGKRHLAGHVGSVAYGLGPVCLDVREISETVSILGVPFRT